MSEALTLKGVYTGASDEGPLLIGVLVEGKRSVLKWLVVDDRARFEEFSHQISVGDSVTCRVVYDEIRQRMILIDMERSESRDS
jgi:hypothetical protein